MSEDLEAVGTRDADQGDAGRRRPCAPPARSAPTPRPPQRHRSSPTSAPSRPRCGSTAAAVLPPPRRHRAPERRQACRARCAGRHPRAARPDRAADARRRRRAPHASSGSASAPRARLPSRCGSHPLRTARSPRCAAACARHLRGFPARTGRSRSDRRGDAGAASSQSARSGASHMRSSMPQIRPERRQVPRSRAADCTMPSVKAEAQREVFQVGRRRQHHRIGAAVIGERDRRLLRDRAHTTRCLATTPGGAHDAADRLGHRHLAGTASMRRLRRVSSRYSSCHSLGPFDGDTCTAVTLYSGQFVAQSE